MIEIGNVSGTHDWTFYKSRVFTLPAMPSDAVALWFLFDFNAGAGTAWWDNVSLRCLSCKVTAGTITEFAVPTAGGFPWGITAGPDGAVWFTESSVANKIGRITIAGSFSEFATPTAASIPVAITAGPDGALWFTEESGNKIVRITTSGVVTGEFTIPTAFSGPVGGIAAGPDGALWFTELQGNKIGRITTAGSFSEFAVPTAGGSPWGITAGPDGALWFTESSGNKIGRITTAGSLSEFAAPPAPSGTGPVEITAGPDGALWFTEFYGNKIGRITTAGSFSEFAVPTAASFPEGITAGPDGALWFTEVLGNKIGRITTAGSFSEFAIPTAASYPIEITAGAGRGGLVHRIQRQQDWADHDRMPRGGRRWGVPGQLVSPQRLLPSPRRRLIGVSTATERRTRAPPITASVVRTRCVLVYRMALSIRRIRPLTEVGSPHTVGAGRRLER